MNVQIIFIVFLNLPIFFAVDITYVVTMVKRLKVRSESVFRLNMILFLLQKISDHHPLFLSLIFAHLYSHFLIFNQDRKN